MHRKCFFLPSLSHFKPFVNSAVDKIRLTGSLICIAGKKMCSIKIHNVENIFTAEELIFSFYFKYRVFLM